MNERRTAILSVTALLLVVVAVPFFAATTFHGDDHIFLAYARHAPHPFVAFVSDAHGGEYYRPLPMLAWWVLGRAGGGSGMPFAALAFLLHAGAAALTGWFLHRRGRPSAVAAGAAALMLLAPQNIDAASWFSASTDLFAAVFVLAALIALSRGRTVGAAAAALAAYLSKESAYVLPLLSLLVLRELPWRRRLAAVAPSVVVLAAVLVARSAVLHGIGGAGDARAGFGAKLLLQIPAGLALVFTGEGLFPFPVALGLGAAIIALATFSAVRGRRAAGAGGWVPFAFCGIASLPLLAADWAVGARYFYLPAIGLAWALADALADVGGPARAVIAGALMLVGGLQAMQRRADIVSYDRRVAAARRVVAAGLPAGHRVFYIASGVKDLDLAVKEDRHLPPAAAEALVLTDVPASFVIVPPALVDAAAPLRARPPLPPSGAYRFGDTRVVGLARADDEPSLTETLARFPAMRFVRLRPVPSGQIIARDVTDETEQALEAGPLDEEADDGQD
jgi:hypothetical protein